MSQPKVKWLPTDEDKKDCHRCRNGWILVKNALGFRAHWETDEKLLTCHAKGPLQLAPEPPKRDGAAIRRGILQRFGYFLVGDIAIGAVAALVYAVYYGIYYVLDKLPGGVETALHFGRGIAVDAVVGISCIYAAISVGEFIVKTFKKPVTNVEPTT